MIDAVSKILIGTTKFGMPYGIFDESQVAEADVKKILDLACRSGISCFDTAPGYGEAESLLGRYLVPGLKNHCVTKVAKVSCQDITNYELSKIDECFNNSLNNMGAEKCYGLLVHDVRDLYKTGNEKLFAWMQLQKRYGLVNKIGVSVYSPEEARSLYEKYKFDLIQIPCSIFDQRFRTSGTLEWLASKGIEVHARSLFMKGMLARKNSKMQLNNKDIPVSLLKHTALFYEHAHGKRTTPYDLSIGFMKAQQNIDRWVIGISSEVQLKKLISSCINNDKTGDFSQWAFNEHTHLDPRSW